MSNIPGTKAIFQAGGVKMSWSCKNADRATLAESYETLRRLEKAGLRCSYWCAPTETHFSVSGAGEVSYDAPDGEIIMTSTLNRESAVVRKLIEASEARTAANLREQLASLADRAGMA